MAEERLTGGKSPQVTASFIAVEEEGCALCGLPVRGRAAREGKRPFCCTGCKQVFLALTAATGTLPDDFKRTDLYLACVKAGIIPVGPEDDGVEPAPTDQTSSLPALDLSFRLGNMWCPACAWLVEEVLRKRKGVIEPRVSFLADAVRLKYLPHLVTPSEIMSTVSGLGYHVRPSDSDRPEGAAQRYLLLRLGISAILSMNAMMLSWTIYFGLFRDLGPTVVAYLSYPLLFITAPVIFYGGMPILRNAWVGLRIRRVSMDTLIAVSTLAAFLYSLIQMARGSIHLYFDTAAMLVTIVLLGRYLEVRARHRVFEGIGLEELGSLKARLQVEGLDRWVRAEALIPGDVFVVRSSERIALDGRIVGGEALVDQSVLTGEPKPVPKGLGDEVLAGSLVTEGEVRVCARKILKESSLSRMFDLVLDALETRNRGESLVDSISRLFVPALIAITICAACLLWFLDLPPEEILLRSLTMLLISCPCAIGIAVPLVKVAIFGLARSKGILIRNPEALEKVPHIDAIVIDKTGTITEGRFTLHRVVAEGIGERDLFPLLAALEGASVHILAREIVRHTAGLGLRAETATEIEEFEGRGITGVVAGRRLFIGNRRLVAQLRAHLPASFEDRATPWEQQGMTVVFFGWNGIATGFLVLGDPIRSDARTFISWLQNRNIKPFLYSGDGNGTTEAVARSLSITDFAGQMLPMEKAEAVKALQEGGAGVAMVGDGINDLAALAASDVGIAFGAGFNPAGQTADLILISPRISGIEDLFVIAALSTKKTRQNLVFAFAYNALAIPLAAAGFLNPIIAVFAMFASSLTVIGNALTIVRLQHKPL